MKLGKIVASCLAAVSLAAGLNATAAPLADAAPAGNIVTFGDSFAANPDQLRHFMRRVDIPEVQQWVHEQPIKAGCMQGPRNWPRYLGHAAGAPVSDWSCTAQTSQSVLSRIDGAIASGDLHPGTRSVVISVGINDYGPYGIQQGYDVLNQAAMSDRLTANMHRAAGKIRSVAPNANIVLAGMPAVSMPYEPHLFCTINVIPDFPTGLPALTLNNVENQVEANQRRAARETGMTFVEMRGPTANNSTCAPDGQRYVSGFIDTTTPDYMMAVHPSDAGNHFIAGRLAGAV